MIFSPFTEYYLDAALQIMLFFIYDQSPSVKIFQTPYFTIKNERSRLSAIDFFRQKLVEVRGIEPLSEGPTTEASTSVACALNLAFRTPTSRISSSQSH